MTRCRRCDWHADPDLDIPDVEQLAEHSLDSSHPLCVCCHNSLPEEDLQTCAGCLTRAREYLSGIITLYTELPTHLGHPRTAAYDSTPAADDGHPLPGGDVLVLLSRGSQGLAEDTFTSHDDDPSSVAFELHFWAQDMRDRWAEPDTPPPLSVAAQVRRDAGYLERRMWRAATTHPAFDEYASDLRRLHLALERATGRSEVRTRAEADCFDCDGPLIREVTDRGYSDDFTCQHCHRVYDWHAYVLALKSKLEQDTGGWVPVEEAARRLNVPAATLRTWIRRGVLSATCTALPGVKDKHWRVHPDEVAAVLARRAS